MQPCSKRHTAMVRPMSYLSRWILYRNWPHWYRNRESIWHDSTVYLLQIVNTEPWSHLPSAGRACKKKTKRQKISAGQWPGFNAWNECSPKVGALGDIDIESCEYCGGHVKVIACIEDQPVIDKILSHLEKKGELPSTPDTLPETRAPPPVSLFYWQQFVSWFEVLPPIGDAGCRYGLMMSFSWKWSN